MVLDPKNCGALYPATVVEAGVKTATESGIEIATYSGFDPWIIWLKEIATMRNINTELRVAIDSGTDVLKMNTGARYDYGDVEEVDLISKDSMVLHYYSTSGAGNQADQIYRYALRVTKPTVYEKIKHKIRLGERTLPTGRVVDEKEIDETFGISKKINAGIMKVMDTPQFESVKEVAKIVDASADENPVIDRIIHAPHGKKVVLLGISCEPHKNPNEVFVVIDRDANDELQKWDTYALPPVDYEQECYIPAIDKIRVELENTAAVTDLRIRFRYGVAPITILERIKWGITLSEDEKAIADEYSLEEASIAGVL